jgi:hypothetical protein
MKPTSSMLRGFHALGVSLLSLWITQARAANIWDGGGADGNWSSLANWDDDALPLFPVALNFAGSAQLASINDQTGITVNGITFDAVPSRSRATASCSAATSPTTARTCKRSACRSISQPAGRSMQRPET